ncbi:hypothetical protein HYU11_02360 [Candidatus Woesearchaeota archaeon]|nr:hypothetical protein [Candidatus Woesearchaeota archaeon]
MLAKDPSKIALAIAQYVYVNGKHEKREVNSVPGDVSDLPIDELSCLVSLFIPEGKGVSHLTFRVDGENGYKLRVGDNVIDGGPFVFDGQYMSIGPVGGHSIVSTFQKGPASLSLISQMGIRYGMALAAVYCALKLDDFVPPEGME